MKTLIATTFATALLVSGTALAETIGAEFDRSPAAPQVTADASAAVPAAPSSHYHTEIGDLSQFAPLVAVGGTATVDLSQAAGFTSGVPAHSAIAGDAASHSQRVLR